MARLYADEQFPKKVSEKLRAIGHDVLTVQEAGNANLGIPDDEVLAFAVNDNRAVITLNRQDFIRRLIDKDESINNVIVISSTNNKAVENVIEKLDEWLTE